MIYRTKTYIAADWDHDVDAVNRLYQWNNSCYWSLSFHDAHQAMQSRDSSLYCSIKRSLQERMRISKRFVLIVGDKTAVITKGCCQYCPSYLDRFRPCARGYHPDTRSFVAYECEMALRNGIPIVVLYKSTRVNREKCPAALRNIGTHAPMYYRKPDDSTGWDYNSVKRAFGYL